ncbi:MAG: hypothetical protein ACR2NY_00805 [Alphaproteobacteria bacterium]
MTHPPYLQKTNGSQSFKLLGVHVTITIGLLLFLYYMIGLYHFFFHQTPINFDAAFYYLGIVLSISGSVYVGSKFANNRQTIPHHKAKAPMDVNFSNKQHH